MAGDQLGGPPPMPGMGMSANGPSPAPSFQGLAGQQQPGAQSPSAGGQQIGGALMRMGLEVDQALKLMAQASPTLAPWVEKTVMELRQQLGQAMAAGAPTNPSPQGQGNFPGGASNL